MGNFYLIVISYKMQKKFLMSSIAAVALAQDRKLFFHDQQSVDQYKSWWSRAYDTMNGMLAENAAELEKGPKLFKDAPYAEAFNEAYDLSMENARETYNAVVPELKKSVKAMDKIQKQVRGSRAFKRMMKRKREMKQLMKGYLQRQVGIEM